MPFTAKGQIGRGAGVWDWNMQALRTDYGLDPIGLPPGTFSVASGIDGRRKGVSTRYPGHQVWGPLTVEDTINFSTPVHTDPAATIDEIHPFQIVRGTGPNYWQGFVYRLLLPGTNPRIRIVARSNGDFQTVNGIDITQTITGGVIPATGRLCVAVWTRFLYICSEDGTVQYVVHAPAPGGTLVSAVMGRQFDLDPPQGTPAVVGWDVPGYFGGGTSARGQSHIRVQLFDPVRLRRTTWSPLNALTFSGTAHQTAQVRAYATGGLAAAQAWFNAGYTQVECDATINSDDPDIPAGGYYHQMDRMPLRISPVGAIFRAALFQTTRLEAPDGVTDHQLAITDPTLFTQRTISDVDDEAGSVPRAIDMIDFRNVTLIASDENGWVLLRHGVVHRIEKETFPEINATRLPLVSSGPVRFLPVGNTAYLFGSGPYYRIDIQDDIVNPRQMGRDKPLMSRWAITSLDNTIFVGTQNGFYQIDGATASEIKLQALDRLVYERWKGNFQFVEMAYDQVLHAVLIANTRLEEMVVLWLGTNRLTHLHGVPIQALRDVEWSGKRRAMFINKRVRSEAYVMVSTTRSAPELGWFSNAALSAMSLADWEQRPYTMWGFDQPRAKREVSDLDYFGYNARVTGITNGLDAFGGGWYSVTLDFFRPTLYTGVPFLNNVNVLEHMYAGYELYNLVPSRRGAKYKVFGTVVPGALGSVTVKLIKASSTTPDLVVGDIISVSPVPVELVGSTLEVPDGRVLARKVTKDLHAALHIWRGLNLSQGVLGGIGLFEAGIIYTNDLVTQAVHTAPPGTWTNWTLGSLNPRAADVLAGTTSYSDPLDVRAPLILSGYAICPLLRCWVSDMDFSLHELRVDGIITQHGNDTP